MDARLRSVGGRMADVWDTAAGKPPTACLGQERWATRQQLLRIHIAGVAALAGWREPMWGKDREAEAEAASLAEAEAEAELQRRQKHIGGVGGGVGQDEGDGGPEAVDRQKGESDGGSAGNGSLQMHRGCTCSQAGTRRQCRLSGRRARPSQLLAGRVALAS